MIATGVAIFLHFANIFSEMRKEFRNDNSMSDESAVVD